MYRPNRRSSDECHQRRYVARTVKESAHANVSRDNSNRLDANFGRLFVKRFALCYRTVVLFVCLFGMPYLSVTLVHCHQTAGLIKVKLGTEVGLGPGHILSDGDQAPLAKKGRSAAPNFRPMYRGQTAGWIKMKLGTEVGLDHTTLC